MPRNAVTPLPQPVFDEPTFNEIAQSQGQSTFSTPHGSDTAQYNQIQDLLAKDVVLFSASRGEPGDLYTLESALGPHGTETIQQITTAGQIIFHAAGDTGASNAGKYGNELSVANQLTTECQTAVPGAGPAFLFHLGDVVYDFGEAKYYYDQFYEPFRNYPAPIFAIPGNHDSFVIPGTPPDQTPLSTFTRNFCAATPVITPEAASLHRTAMTQPGVYYALDAPFVRIIALFSNALEDPGVISSEGGTWSTLPDVQLDYLTAQFQAIKAQNYAGAVLIAVHHPPFTYAPPPQGSGAGGDHSSSSDMLRQIDTICVAQGVYPHAFISGHAHNYQRYTRNITFGGANYTVPYIICGDGGHNVNPIVQAQSGQPAQEPGDGTDVSYLEVKPAVTTSGVVLNKHNDADYGYLRITADSQKLKIDFQAVAATDPSASDSVTVNLETHTIV